MLFGVWAWAAAADSEFAAVETPRFHLCQSFVANAALGHSERAPERLFVDVELTPAGASALVAFTRAHLGEVVRVLVGSALVVETRVRAIVDSGRIRSGAQTRASAEALAELLAYPPAEPCGVEAPSA